MRLTGLMVCDDIVCCVGSVCLWAHVVGAYLFTVVIMAALYKEYQMVRHTHPYRHIYRRHT